MDIYGKVKSFLALVMTRQSSAPAVDTNCSEFFADTNGKPKVVIDTATVETEHHLAKSQAAGHEITLTTSGTTALTVPTSGTVATLAGTETLTNKYLDGGTASTSNKWKLPQDTLANLTALARAEGMLYYANDVDKVYYDNGSALVETGSGSGQGEKNYITNSSASTVITGWATSDAAKLTVARTTTAAELPREYTTGTGIKILSVASADSTNAYIYYDFNLDDVDLNKKLKITWAQKLVGAYASGDLTVYIAAAASRATPLHTPVTTSIANADGVFTTSFDSASTAALSLVIKAPGNMADNVGLVLSDVIVGPGTQPQGAVVSSEVSYTPAIANVGTPANLSAVYQRVGSNLNLRVSWVNGTGGSGAIAIPLPSGLTIDSTRVGGGARGSLGKYWSTTAGVTFIESSGNSGTVFFDGTDTANLYLANKTASATAYAKGAISTMSADSSLISLVATIPIAEWAGSGTVNLAQNDVEYAYNSSTDTGAGDTTSFGYGPQGAVIQNNTTVLSRRVRFQSPIRVSDSLIVEVSTDRIQWFPLTNWALVNGRNISAHVYQNPYNYGLGRITPVNTTDVDILFGHYCFPSSTYGAAGEAWSSGAGSGYWRVRKTSAGAAVGFGEVVPGTSAGLVSANGLKGRTDGQAVASGYVGEVKTTTSDITGTTAGTSDTDVTNASLSLEKGIWRIEYSVTAIVDSAAAAGSNIYMYTVITDSVGNHLGNSERICGVVSPSNAVTGTRTCLYASIDVRPTTTTVYKLMCKRVDASGPAGTASVGFAGGAFGSHFKATRIG